MAAAINSAVALYYYVNLIRLMYFNPPAEPAPLRPAPVLGLALGVCAAATLFLGLFPGSLLTLLSSGPLANLL